MPNYNYVAGAHYKPYSMQEMLVPFMLYKEESDKREQDYLNYAEKMDAIKQAAEEAGGEAAQIYNTYNNDYQKAFSNYLNHGLGMGNKRDWLNLKRRYKGEIGKLEDADKVLKEIQKDMRDKGPSYLWGDEAPTLNNILNNSSYMNYGISTDDLYKRGVQSATASSTGIYNNPRVQDVTKYYQEIIQSQGYSPAVIAKFRDDLEAIPEFNDAINNIMMETGAEDHLSGIAYGRAKQSIINGLIDGAGAAYKESRSIKDNPGVLTAAQSVHYGQQERSQKLTEQRYGYKWNGKEHVRTSESEHDKDWWKYTHDPVTGERTGYSPTYLSQTKSKSNTGKGNPDNGDAHTIRSPFKISTKGNTKGTVSSFDTSKNASRGKSITYAEALQLTDNDRELMNLSGWENNYDFYLDEYGNVGAKSPYKDGTVIKKSKDLGGSGSQNPENPVENEEDDNQL